MKILLAICLILMAGCANRITTLIVPELERSNAFLVKDKRPDSEKLNKIFSLMTTSEAFATYRIGDAFITPTAVRLLQHRAFEKLGAKNPPHDMTIHHLAVYRNMQTELRRGALDAAIGGAIGAMVAIKTSNLVGTNTVLVDREIFESSIDEEYKRAFYSPPENPNRTSVYIIYIETEIGDKRFFTRTISPMKTKESDTALDLAIETAIQAHVSQY
jgi:hypothetical protein